MKKLLLTFVILFGALNLQAAQTWDEVQKGKVLNIGLCAAYPPFESRDAKNGTLEGFDIDLANAIAKKLNIKIKINDAQWQALFAGLKTNKYDMLMSAISKQEAGKENVNMSDTYYKLYASIVVKKGDDKIKSVDDLKGKNVGVQIGSGSEQIADKLKGLKKVARYDYNPEAFIDLKLGRIDAIIVGYAYAVVQKDFAKNFKIADTIEPAEVVAVMRKNDDTLKSKIDTALKELKADGTYDKLVKKWLVVK